MAFLDKINQVAKNIGDKTGDAIETTKLNNKIRTERTAATEDFKKIGEYYYNLFVAGNETAPEILEYCQSAKAHFDAAAEAQAEIDSIKAANEAPATPVAPAPSAPVTPSGIACPSCGTMNGDGTRFCKNCGTNLEVKPNQPRVCPSCGTAVEAGVSFCSNCGHKMEG